MILSYNMMFRRRRRFLIFLLSVSLAMCLSLLMWIKYEEEPLLDLPDLSDPLPADLSMHPLYRRSVTLYDANFSFFLNISEYSEVYPALQNYRCRAVIGLLGYCKTQETLVLMAVKSHPISSDRRDALRRTWAKDRVILGYRFKPLFLMANSGRRRLMERVMTEASIFGDIILWDFLESHHHLSLKERCFLEWMHYRCPEAVYIFKGDDDEFVNPYSLANYISSSATSFPNQIHGYLQVNPPPDRDGKYGVPVSIYPHGYYPPFVSGGGFLLPASLVPSLRWAASTIPVFPLDDVFIGFLALAADIPFHHEPRFRSFGLKTDKLCYYWDALVVHGLTPKRMLEVWEALPSAPTCPPTTEREEINDEFHH
ncbi:UDP-GlcNAc:betaGal beta-1,3-N-acetylglucosaminyltransferase 7 isoform X2 [Bombina bombina]|nr:UDP-GlcNAc:betaGal beta-1,3-N-acetylglucosaminyltransferase 7 isoform X2 [Bombina bombina]